MLLHIYARNKEQAQFITISNNKLNFVHIYKYTKKLHMPPNYMVKIFIYISTHT